jgi:NADH:ubiquinone oxidoreductase subunit 4 (subunit M)
MQTGQFICSITGQFYLLTTLLFALPSYCSAATPCCREDTGACHFFAKTLIFQSGIMGMFIALNYCNLTVCFSLTKDAGND